jgi:hypothetical protein
VQIPHMRIQFPTKLQVIIAATVLSFFFFPKNASKIVLFSSLDDCQSIPIDYVPFTMTHIR